MVRGMGWDGKNGMDIGWGVLKGGSQVLINSSTELSWRSRSESSFISQHHLMFYYDRMVLL